MIKNDNIILCPFCSGNLKYYDSVRRIVFSKYGNREYIQIRRYRCKICNRIHRAIPNNIFPYKRYEAEIIVGVLEGFITNDTLGFENYPCEKTMARWSSQKIQLLL